MKAPIFSIRDKYFEFGAPTVDSNEYSAKRNFAFAVNNPNTGVLGFAASDYDLYCVGYFDTVSGVLSNTDSGVPEFIVNGATLLRKDDVDGCLSERL